MDRIKARADGYKTTLLKESCAHNSSKMSKNLKKMDKKEPLGRQLADFSWEKTKKYSRPAAPQNMEVNLSFVLDKLNAEREKYSWVKWQRRKLEILDEQWNSIVGECFVESPGSITTNGISSNLFKRLYKSGNGSVGAQLCHPKIHQYHSKICQIIK